MIRGLSKALIAGLSLVLTACATPYQSSGMFGGLRTEQVSEDMWLIAFGGNGFTTDTSAQAYWLYRAANLALAEGYDGFAVLNDLQPNVSLAGYPSLVGGVRLLHAPLVQSPGVIFPAQALVDYLQPYVEGDKCDGNVCPHVRAYLYPGFGSEPAPR